MPQRSVITTRSTEDLLQSCEAATDEVVKLVSQFAAALRSANLHTTEDNKFHPFSPEVADVWEGVTQLARSIRSIDGDKDDVNYLLRAREIEHSLEDAVESQPKLALAESKVANLEKVSIEYDADFRSMQFTEAIVSHLCVQRVWHYVRKKLQCRTLACSSWKSFSQRQVLYLPRAPNLQSCLRHRKPALSRKRFEW